MSFFLHVIFLQIQRKRYVLGQYKLIRGIESNCEMILELHFWLETALKCSFSVPPNICQLLMGTSHFALPAQLYFHWPSWEQPLSSLGIIRRMISKKKLLVQPALTFPINLYRLGLSEIQQMLDTRPAPALAGDTAVAPFGSLSGLESSPPNTCNSVLSLSFKNGPHYCWYRKLSGTALGLDPNYTAVRYRIPVHSVSGYSEFSFWLYIRCDMIILI